MTIVQIEGVFNARDLGGLPAADGRVRPGMLLRSGSLSGATASAVAELRGRVERIVDLRDDQEVSSQPSATADIPTTHLPLFVGSVASFFERDTSLEQLYAHLVEESGPRLVEAVRVLSQGEPTLVHCTVGKDRTGVTVALALAAAGVAREAIIEDYALTASQLPADRNRQITAFLRSVHPEATHAVALATLSPAPVMRALLADMDARWGSPTAYLREHGLEAGELAQLREALIDSRG